MTSLSRFLIEFCIFFGAFCCILINFTNHNNQIVFIGRTHQHSNNNNNNSSSQAATATQSESRHRKYEKKRRQRILLQQLRHDKKKTTIETEKYTSPINTDTVKTISLSSYNNNNNNKDNKKNSNDNGPTSGRNSTSSSSSSTRRLDDDTSNNSKTSTCPCGTIMERPDLTDKVLTARWMVHTLDWGVLTTISSRTTGTGTDNNSNDIVKPFGNVYSFVDGSCTNSTGTPYLYGSYLDQSFKDMIHNPYVSLTLSEATLGSTCYSNSDSFITKACVIVPNFKNLPTTTTTAIHMESTSTTTTPLTTTTPATETTSKQHSNNNGDSFPGDPESPLCARLTISGKLVEITTNTTTTSKVDDENNNNNNNNNDEYTFALQSLYERHPQMKYWPTNHHWTIVKLIISDVWLIDYFGGATIIQPNEYYNSTLP